MCKFYNEYFLQSSHELTKSEVDVGMKIFRLGYSDNFVSNIYPQQIPNEDIKASQLK